ncbi:MAG: hypothetical protein ABIU09_10970, partial [Pyrinomonadaceae bacterium]
MKRCPECRRAYYDDALLYCLDDGNALLEGPATPGADEPATAILRGSEEPGQSPTRPQNNTTDQTANVPAGIGADTAAAKRKTYWPIAAIALLIVTGGVGFAAYKFWGKPAKPAQALKIERLNTNGKSANAAISPDGKYVVYSVDEGGGQSLWVRQTAASSSVQIIPPAEDVYYWGLTFTPDSDYINFTKVQFEKNVGWALHQMPVLGGTQKILITDADGGVSYSPDGKQFAFLREEYPTAAESSLLIANSDGTGERILASRKAPETFPSRERSPAW